MEGCKGAALLVGTALFAFSGCAPYSRTSTAAAPPAAAIVVAPAPSEVGEHGAPDPRVKRLLAYAARSRSFSPQRLQAEYAAASEAEHARPNAEARIRLAILLTHPRAPFRDDARARRLLHEAADARAGIGDLARLLDAAVDQRADLEGALARERSRRAELQHKLEQLKTIEQEIDRRAPAAVVRERQ